LAWYLASAAVGIGLPGYRPVLGLPLLAPLVRTKRCHSRDQTAVESLALLKEPFAPPVFLLATVAKP
jgi:hypothetical protein